MNQAVLVDENQGLKTQVCELSTKVVDLEAKNLDLQAQIAWFNKQLFGKKSEKTVDTADANQLKFDGFEVEETEEPKGKPVSGHTRKPPKKGSDKIRLPDDIPIEKQIIDLPEEKKIDSDGASLIKIGEEITSKLAYKPGSYYIKQIIRPKYAKDGTITIAPLPPTLLNHCRADDSLLSSLCIAKYIDHLPLYRISEILNRQGIHISRKILSKWLIRVAEHLKPLYKALETHIYKTQNIYVDETPTPMLSPGKGQTHQGYMWIIAGGTTDNPPYRVYHYKTTRAHHHIIDLLKNYKGLLHSDKYGAYEKLAQNPHINWAPCWVHIRRKFYDLTDQDSQYILRKINHLFAYERHAWTLNDEQRVSFRKEKQIPIIDKIVERAKQASQNPKHLPKSPLTKALGYLLSLTPYLKTYTNHPHARLDNNVAERAVRPLTLGRKNWLFLGSEKGGEAGAIIYSIVQSAKASGVNVQEYLEDIMKKINDYRIDKLHELLPQHWAKDRTDSG